MIQRSVFMVLILVGVSKCLLIEDVRIVQPFISNSEGVKISNDLHFGSSKYNTETSKNSRQKRADLKSNIDKININIEDKLNAPEEQIFVGIRDGGNDILLQLTKNTNLVSSATVVEWYYRNGQHAVGELGRNCFYSGKDLRAVGPSIVAVSNCDGLVGYIQTNNNSYFIEPLTDKLRNKFVQNKWSNFKRKHRFRLEQTEPVLNLLGIPQETTGIFTGPISHVIYGVQTVNTEINLSKDQDFSRFSKMNLKTANHEETVTELVNIVKHLVSSEESAVKEKLKNTSQNIPDNVPIESVLEDLFSPSNFSASQRLKGTRKHRKKRYLNKSQNLGEIPKSNYKKLTNEITKQKDNQESQKKTKQKKVKCKSIFNLLNNTNIEIVSTKFGRINLKRCQAKNEKRMKRRKKKGTKKKGKKKKGTKKKGKKKKGKKKKGKKKKRKNKKKKKKKQKTKDTQRIDIFQDPLKEETWQGYSPDAIWETQIAPGQSGLTLMELVDPRGTDRDPEKWVELTVAVDHTVIEFHGRDRVQGYVISLLNIVSAIYEDPTLAANLNIALLRLIFYEDEKQGKVTKGLAKKSLEEVNKWAETLHRLSSAPLKHDVGVWLTKLELGGPSGYAPVAGVCDPSRSCTLNRDEGLTSSFIIAHEMGHILGLTHDGDIAYDNNCELESYFGSVMAPLVAATFGKFHWSSCSKREYHNAAKAWTCLTDRPQWKSASVVPPSVKISYSLNDQCRMEFGDGYGLCQTLGIGDPCSSLWCSNSSTPYVCKTKKGPPLRGTICAPNKWCSEGICKDIPESKKVQDKPEDSSEEMKANIGAPVQHNPQHGAWSPWSPWGPCSRPCDTGAMFRTRECDSPRPLWGGRTCRGRREEWKICYIGECSKPIDLREQMCGQLSDLVDLGKRRASFQWLPYEMKGRLKKCRLSCISSSTNEVYYGREHVIDGNPCTYRDPHSICVQGKCVAMGCDHVMGSSLRWDGCGVCGGNGSECRTVTFHYEDTPKSGYTELIVIPKNARKISVREKLATPNDLSLLDGSFRVILNRPGEPEVNREFVSEGTLFEYIRYGEKESLYVDGPILRPITVMILGRNVRQKTTVTITYVVKEDKRMIYQWVVGPLSPCTVSCGGGLRRVTINCRYLLTQVFVNEDFCGHLQRPKLKASACNQFKCKFLWVESDWEQCSATCGRTGKQERQVSCVLLKNESHIDDHNDLFINKTQTFEEFDPLMNSKRNFYYTQKENFDNFEPLMNLDRNFDYTQKENFDHFESLMNLDQNFDYTQKENFDHFGPLMNLDRNFDYTQKENFDHFEPLMNLDRNFDENQKENFDHFEPLMNLDRNFDDNQKENFDHYDQNNKLDYKYDTDYDYSFRNGIIDHTVSHTQNLLKDSNSIQNLNNDSIFSNSDTLNKFDGNQMDNRMNQLKSSHKTESSRSDISLQRNENNNNYGYNINDTEYDHKRNLYTQVYKTYHKNKAYKNKNNRNNNTQNSIDSSSESPQAPTGTNHSINTEQVYKTYHRNKNKTYNSINKKKNIRNNNTQNSRNSSGQSLQPPTGTNHSINTDKNFLVVSPSECRGDEKPTTVRPCNTVPCPAHWLPSGLTQCSVTCGMGEQEVIFTCSQETEVDSKRSPNCGEKPRQIRACFAGKCENINKGIFGVCARDKSPFCKLPTLVKYCKIPKYFVLCCATCSENRT